MSETAGVTSSTGEPTESPGVPAGAPQATVLIAGFCLSVLATVLIAPVQPRMAAAFADTPGVAALVPIVVTVPSLLVAFLAPLAGRIADRTGRVRLLTVSLVFYAVFGVAPLWLPTLWLVIASRVGVGIAEAAIMTCSITLIADLWSGEARARLLGREVIAASLTAVVFAAVGGLVGASGWRTPFVIYVVGLPLAALTARLVRNPVGLHTGDEALPPLNWRPLVAPVAMALLGGIIFFAPVLELSYKLAAIGVTATVVIGLLSALASLATAAGAAAFGPVAGRGPQTLLPVALVVCGVGLLVLGAGDTVVVVAAGAIVCSAGCGLLRPALLMWALAPLQLLERGRATGIWTAGSIVGQFICPLLVLVLGMAFGGLSAALVALGVGAVVLAAVSRRLARPRVAA